MGYLINWLASAVRGIFQSACENIFQPVFSFLYAAFALLFYYLLGIIFFGINCVVLLGIIVTDQICYLFGSWLPGILNYNNTLSGFIGSVDNACGSLQSFPFLRWSLYWFWTDIIKTSFFSLLAFVLPILVFKIAFRIIRG